MMLYFADFVLASFQTLIRVTFGTGHQERKRLRRLTDRARNEQLRPKPEAALRSLPASRLRCLTCTDHGDSQSLSVFITSIPVEIRLLIWQYTLGPESEGDVLHIDLGDGGLRYCRCYDPKALDKLSFKHEYWKTVWTKKARDRGIFGYLQLTTDLRKIQSLLLTCRIIYDEANDILYESNIFDFRRSTSTTRLPKVLLPHRFQRIRKIRISTAFAGPIRVIAKPNDPPLSSDDFYLPDKPISWTTACEVLSNLEHLEDLQIIIALWWLGTATIKGHEEALVLLLEPLKPARTTRFRVVLTEPFSDEASRRLGATSFDVSQRDKTGVGMSVADWDN